MSTIDDRPPTLGERYSCATESSNLRLAERRGDVDLIIAAGLVPDGLASALYRLQSEYDGVRSEHQAAEQRMRESEADAKRQPHDEAGSARAKRIIDDAQGAAVTAHILILAQLRSLRETKERFGQFAVVEATRHRFMKPDREALILAGRVLDVVLSPNCRHCEGRGFTGGGRHEQSGAQVICRPCRGSGHRRDLIGRDDAERTFAGHLLMQVDALMAQAGRDIRTGLNRLDEAKRLIEAAAD